MDQKQNPKPAKAARPEGFDPRLLREAARLAAALGFEPVPLRRRRDGWTPERQLVYLAVLAAGGGSREAAGRVGMTVQGAGKLLRRPDARAFAGACAAACRIGEASRVALAAARRQQARAAARERKFFRSREAETSETCETSAEPSATGVERGRVRPARSPPRSGRLALAAARRHRYEPTDPKPRRTMPC